MFIIAIHSIKSKIGTVLPSLPTMKDIYRTRGALEVTYASRDIQCQRSQQYKCIRVGRSRRRREKGKDVFPSSFRGDCAEEVNSHRSNTSNCIFQIGVVTFPGVHTDLWPVSVDHTPEPTISIRNISFKTEYSYSYFGNRVFRTVRFVLSPWLEFF